MLSFSSTKTSRWSVQFSHLNQRLYGQLMQEANIRLIELRHTLPNLKSLLLTLSSPIAPPSRPSISGSSTYVNSRSSSRTWSHSLPMHSPSPNSSVGGRESPAKGLDTPSPSRKVARKSMLSRLTPDDVAEPREREREPERESRDPEKDDGEENELSRSVPGIRPLS